MVYTRNLLTYLLTKVSHVLSERTLTRTHKLESLTKPNM